MSSTSDSVSLSSSSSGSMQSRGNVDRRLEEGSVSQMAVVGRIPMETITKVTKDPPEEIAESNWPKPVTIRLQLMFETSRHYFDGQGN